MRTIKSSRLPTRGDAARTVFLAFVLAAVLSWGNSLFAPFVFDDLGAIVENPTIRSLWPPTITLPSFMSGTSVDGRPVTNYSFAISRAIAPDSVLPFRAMNLAIHVAGAITLYLLLCSALSNPKTGGRIGAASSGLAFTAALIWMVHPLQTESVTYIVQRAESLSSLFYLLTLYFSSRYFSHGRKTAAFWAVTACLLGVGSKEIVATAPIAVLLYDRCFHAGTFGEALKSRWRFYLALFSVWIALGGLMAATGNRNGTIGYGFGISAFDYFLTQLWAIPLYLKLAFWPTPLILDRGWATVTEPLKLALGGSVMLTLGVVTVYQLRRNTPAGFALALFFLALGPTSSFIPVNQTISEHRTYLALTSVITLATVLASMAIFKAAGENLNLRRTASVGIAVAVVAASMAATHARNEDYRTALDLWKDTVEKAPDSPRAQINLAYEYLEVENDPEKAIPVLEKILARTPEDSIANLIMGNALASTGNLDRALEYFGKAISLNPGYHKAYNNSGSALLTLGRAEEALPYLAKAVEINPWFELARLNYGMALITAGRHEQAVSQLDTALTLKPGWIKAHYQLGLALLGAGRGKEALAQFTEVLRVLPDSPEAKESYGKALAAVSGAKGAVR